MRNPKNEAGWGDKECWEIVDDVEEEDDERRLALDNKDCSGGKQNDVDEDTASSNYEMISEEDALVEVPLSEDTQMTADSNTSNNCSECASLLQSDDSSARVNDSALAPTDNNPTHSSEINDNINDLEAEVKLLYDMGFSVEDAKSALAAKNNNLQEAIESLLGEGQEFDWVDKAISDASRAIRHTAIEMEDKLMHFSDATTEAVSSVEEELKIMAETTSNAVNFIEARARSIGQAVGQKADQILFDIVRNI